MTRPGALLTERDAALLRSLAEYGWLTMGQVHRLHFASRQTATRRTRRLRRAGLLRGALVSGYPERVFVPTIAGLSAGGIESGRRDPGKLPSGLFLRHTLATADFRISLAESVRQRPDVELLNFVSDSERHLSDVTGTPQSPLRATARLGTRDIAHSPDAAFALRRGGRIAAFYVEIDMGTEVIGSPHRGVGKFVRFYRAAFAQMASAWLSRALHLERAPDAVRALVVTTSPVRVQNIRRVCGGASSSDPMAARIWITDCTALNGPDLLGPMWASLDPTDGGLHAVVAEEARL